MINMDFKITVTSMDQIIDIAFSQVNIFLTVTMLILIAYWLFTMLSGVDFDLDVDIDVDVDIDADLQTGTFTEAVNTEIDDDLLQSRDRRRREWWQSTLIYFNFVGLPFMFTLTCWIFSWWVLSNIATIYTNSYHNSFGFVMVLATLIPSLVLTKIITTPFKNFFKGLNPNGTKPIDFIGMTAITKSSIEDNKVGSIEVTVDTKSIILYAKTQDNVHIPFDQEVLITKHSEDKNFYYVQSLNKLLE